MSNTKKVTVTMTEETEKKAQDLSSAWNIKLLGKDKPNVSGYITYLINKADLEASNESRAIGKDDQGKKGCYNCKHEDLHPQSDICKRCGIFKNCEQLC